MQDQPSTTINPRVKELAVLAFSVILPPVMCAIALIVRLHEEQQAIHLHKWWLAICDSPSSFLQRLAASTILPSMATLRTSEYP